jgi:outer membrane protein TolC
MRADLALIFFVFWMHSASALSLQEAEEIAMANNPQIKKAEELLERARQGRVESVSHWLPQLSALTQAFKTQEPLRLRNLNKPSAFLTQFSLTQNLFSLPLYYKVKIAALIQDQFTHMLEAAKNDILYQARVLYYLVALDHQKVMTAKENVELLENLTRKMEGKYQIGESTAYNVNQARVAIAGVSDSYYGALTQLKSHQDELAEVLGYDPSEEYPPFEQRVIPVESIPELASKIELSHQFFSPKQCFIGLGQEVMHSLFPPEEYTAWNRVAQNYRPDIQLGNTLLSITQEVVRSHRSEYWPTLQLMAGYGGFSTPFIEQPSTRFDNQLMQWAVGLSLQLNIFDGLGRESRIKQSKAERASVQFEVQKILQSAHTEVRGEIYKMEKGLVKFLSASANLQLAQQTLDQAKSRLDIGYNTIYDYLISVDGLIRAKTALDEGKFELMAAYYGLLHACGRR